jgi:hypothetical protein
MTLRSDITTEKVEGSRQPATKRQLEQEGKQDEEISGIF